MGKLPLSKGGFTPIPEGTHIFKVESVKHDEEFGKIELNLVTQDGKKHTERFKYIGNGGEVVQGALNAFSYMAHVLLGDFDIEEIDPMELEGCFMEADVSHDTQPNINKPGQTVTFVRLGDKRMSDGWEEKEPEEETPAPKAKGKVDLKSILG